jgi:NADPH:quinone reductase-like Zn-dependent oxidoreductase
MKAVIWTRYGSPDGLHVAEVAVPTPQDNEVRIRVVAATVTAGDTELRRMQLPLLLRLPIRIYVGVRRPKRITTPGMELAGEVDLVGSGVQRFRPGDAVFAATGLRMGANAEYACLPEGGMIALKPGNVSFAEAATVPIGGIEALTLLRRANIQSGTRVLVFAASGSIGTYAVQLARHFGAAVTGVCSPASMELVSALGAEEVIDYTKSDFTENGQTYDVIFDTIGKSSFSRSSRRSLRKGGSYLLSNPKLSQMLRGPWSSLARGKKVVFGVSSENVEDLVFLKDLIEAGTIKPVVDRRYPLAEIARAHRYVDTGQKIGNVVITLSQEPPPAT